MTSIHKTRVSFTKFGSKCRTTGSMNKEVGVNKADTFRNTMTHQVANGY